MYLAIFAQPPNQKSRPVAPPKFAKEMKIQKIMVNKTRIVVSSCALRLNDEKPINDVRSIGDTKNIPTGENKDPTSPSMFSQIPPAFRYRNSKFMDGYSTCRAVSSGFPVIRKFQLINKRIPGMSPSIVAKKFSFFLNNPFLERK